MNKILELNFLSEELKIYLLEELNIWLKGILVFLPIIFLWVLLFVFNLYLLGKTLNIKIKDFMRENQNAPLPLLWMFFSLYTAIILIWGISYTIEYKPILEFLSEPFILLVFAGSFSGVPTLFILCNLLKHKKALFIVCIIICLFFLLSLKIKHILLTAMGGMNFVVTVGFLMKYFKK